VFETSKQKVTDLAGKESELQLADFAAALKTAQGNAKTKVKEADAKLADCVFSRDKRGPGRDAVLREDAVLKGYGAEWVENSTNESKQKKFVQVRKERFECRVQTALEEGNALCKSFMEKLTSSTTIEKEMMGEIANACDLSRRATQAKDSKEEVWEIFEDNKKKNRDSEGSTHSCHCAEEK